MSEDFPTEEHAFRDALRAAADREPFEALDAAVLPRRTNRSGWSVAAAAAVVVGVVGLLGFAVLPYLQQAQTAGTAAVPEAAPADAGGEESPPQMAPAPARDAALPPPQPGWRWESFRDVAVQVPQEWGYGFAPTSAWCISEDWTEAPYVDLARGGGMVPAILCEGVIPADKLVPHLVLSEPSAAPAESLPDGWSYHRLDVGSVTISVLTDAAGDELAGQILASAVISQVDHNGCPAAVPSGDSGALSQLAGAPLAVCLYDFDAPGVLGLRASVGLTDAAADAAWQAMAAAPPGGGPDDDSASTCQEPTPDPSAGPQPDSVAFVVVDGQAFRFAFSGCTGNGLSDPSPGSPLREVTSQLCRTLLVPPLWVDTAFGPAAEVCLAAVQRP